MGFSGLKQRKTPRRLWNVRASLLNMPSSMSPSRSRSTNLYAHVPVEYIPTHTRPNTHFMSVHDSCTHQPWQLLCAVVAMVYQLSLHCGLCSCILLQRAHMSKPAVFTHNTDNKIAGSCAHRTVVWHIISSIAQRGTAQRGTAQHGTA